MKEQGDVGTYSTVVASSDGYTTNGKTYEIAYTPLLIGGGDVVIPLLNADIRSYIEVIFNAACDAVQRDGSTLQSKILELDSFGVDCMIYGKTVRVKNMIAAVEGGIAAGRILSAADVAAIAGCAKEELDKYFHDTSVFVGYSIKTNPTGAGQYRETTRAVYGPMMLFKAVTNEKGEDEPEDTSLLRKGRYYVIKYGEHWLNQATDGAFTYKFNALTGKYEKEQRDPQVRYYPKQIYNPSTKNYDTVYVKYNPATNTEIQISDPALLIESRVYFIGQSQSHAMTKFVDAMPTAKQIEADKIAEACDNLEYVVVNDPNRIDDLYNSRLTIDKIGRRNLVCSGSEFDGYTSDESAMTVCKYTLWKNCRLTDSITLSMHMIPWLDVNEKVKYAAKYLKSDIAVEWIIKKIDKNIGEGTMNVTLSRYYPYYPYITYENVLKEKYIDNKKDT